MTSTWELHLDLPDGPVPFLEDYFSVIIRNYPDQLDYLVDDDGMHVMVASLKILTMVFGALDHHVVPKSLSVRFSEPFQGVIPDRNSVPSWAEVRAKADLPWEEDDLEHSSIVLVIN